MPDQTAAARTSAIDAVTALSKRSQHSQACPVWTGRATGIPVDRCTCWVRPNAARTVDTVLSALREAIAAEIEADYGPNPARHYSTGWWDHRDRDHAARIARGEHP